MPMLKQLIIVWAITAVAIAVAAVFGLVNAIIGPLLRLLSIPLLLITFGLFALVINAALLGIAAGLSDSLEIGGFFSTVVAAFLISVFSAVLGWAAFRVFSPEQVAAI
jgi:putative membrane protein